jgi:hypothetical protein
VAIRRSAAAEIRELVTALAGGDAVARETASARLGAIGARAVPHLLDAFAASRSRVERVAILKVLDATRDRRGVLLAIDLLATPGRDPAVAAGAIALLGSGLDDEQTQSLETLGTIAVDAARPELERLAAWRMLERMPERILAPLRRRLGRDASAAVRRLAEAAPDSAHTPLAALDPAGLLESAAGGADTDPAVIAAAAASAGPGVPLTTLHRLVELARASEASAPAEADRHEWLLARAALHAALVDRRSRVALYDVVETLERADRPLPDAFATTLEHLGDAAALDVLATAAARAAGTDSLQEQQWRVRLLAAGRAILDRERLTRRHAAVRRLERAFPEFARALFN